MKTDSTSKEEQSQSGIDSSPQNAEQDHQEQTRQPPAVEEPGSDAALGETGAPRPEAAAPADPSELDHVSPDAPAEAAAAESQDDAAPAQTEAAEDQQATGEDEVSSVSPDGEPERLQDLPSTDQLFDALHGMKEQMEKLRKDFESKLLYDQQKQRQIDKLHAELSDYKKRLFISSLQPIYTGLIEKIDDFRAFYQQYKNEEKALANIQGILKQLKSIPD